MALHKRIIFAAVTCCGLTGASLQCFPSPMSAEVLDSYVGAIKGKCCKAGRRWGCDPVNLTQTGCSTINQSSMNCVARADFATLKCTAATCVRSNPEHLCEVDIKTVNKNRCRPTGYATTAGCPENQWQCEVITKHYTLPDSPQADVLVCDFHIATPCATNYSHCD